MYQLDVVNEMLGTMGEAPLATLTAPHSLRGACVRTLTNVNRRIQARGWWFNRETLKITPSVDDGTCYLPNDVLSVRTDHGTRYSQRGVRLYDNEAGDYVRSETTVELVRLVPFDELPDLVRAYIGGEAILQFQRNYDGDSTKTRQIAAETEEAKGWCNGEETRQVKANRIASNPRLMYIKTRVFARRNR